MPLEAQACGAPVIAFGEGGSTETVRGLAVPGRTGIFFQQQSAAAIQAAVLEFETLEIDPRDCRANAERFSNQRFRDETRNFVENAWAGFHKTP